MQGATSCPRISNFIRVGATDDQIVSTKICRVNTARAGNFWCISSWTVISWCKRDGASKHFEIIYIDHSCHKYASNLIEKLLLHGSQPQREQIIKTILIESDSISDSPGRAHAAIAKLTADKYGNYVMQMALEVAAPLEKQLLLSYLSEHSNFLRDSTYGKHLLSYLQ